MNALPYEDDLTYMQDELAWVEARCRRVGAELDLRRLEGGTTDDAEPPHRRGSETASPRKLRDRRRLSGSQEITLRDEIDARLEATRAAGRDLALPRLAEQCGLDAFERTVLLLGCAPCFSQRFDEVFGLMEKDHFESGLTVELAFAFCELPWAERVDRRQAFSKAGALIRNDLMSLNVGARFSSPKDLLMAEVLITTRTFSYVVGRTGLSSEFLEFSSVEEPLVSLDRVVLPDEDKRRILSVVERHADYLRCRRDWGFDALIPYGRGVIMLFHGSPGTGKTMTAHAVAKHLGKRILNVDIPTFMGNREADRFLPALFRESRLHDAVLFFDECEALFGSRLGGNTVMTLLLSELERFEGVAILATNLPQVLDEALDRRVLVKVRFARPDSPARRDIWAAHLPATAPLAEDLDLGALAERFDMSGGYIKNAVLTAVADAVHRGGDEPRIDMDMMTRAAEAQVRRPLDGASRLLQPKVRLEDVVVTEEVGELLAEVVAATRQRCAVLDRWGVGGRADYGRGLSVLLQGAPGTGKTLSAHAIAGELNRPLLPIAMPAILSKWVGEAERNLDAAFRDARAEGALLFLDEADSLLRARGEGRASRHDDSLVNTLLQRLEQHDDLVLMATNRAELLDSALMRRLTWCVFFAAPGPEERAAIWRQHLPVTAPVADDVDVDLFGSRFALSGGDIRSAVRRAALRASVGDGVITHKLLERAAHEQLATLQGKGPISGVAVAHGASGVGGRA